MNPVRTAIILLPLLLLSRLSAAGQDQPLPAKTGWVFTPVPEVYFSTDVGLTLGAFSDFFYYGDGSGYPNFLHHIGVTSAWSSKGSYFGHLMAESKSLIPGYRLTGALTYRKATTNPFYGYNGIHAPYDGSLDHNDSTGEAYYFDDRELIRAVADIRGPLGGGDALKWTAGAQLRSIRIQPHSATGSIAGAWRSLYMDYRNAGLIRGDEAGGGISLEARAGLTYDSRDIEMVPRRGLYAELYLAGNKDISHGHYDYAQVIAHLRHFVPIIFDRLTFAYHLAFQQQIAGEMPWYTLSEIDALTYLSEESEGLGSRYTIRGFRYNRILGAGYAWGNFELRARLLGFDLFGEHFDVVVNPFFDCGAVTRQYRAAEQEALGARFWQDSRQRIHGSAGCGGKIHMNTNFILSAEIAKAFDPRLSRFTVSMATTYMF